MINKQKKQSQLEDNVAEHIEKIQKEILDDLHFKNHEIKKLLEKLDENDKITCQEILKLISDVKDSIFLMLKGKTQVKEKCKNIFNSSPAKKGKYFYLFEIIADRLLTIEELAQTNEKEKYLLDMYFYFQYKYKPITMRNLCRTYCHV